MVCWAPFLVLDDVVVIGPEKRTIGGKPCDECREVEISTSARLFEGVIQIAAVDENSDARRVMTSF